MIKNKTTGKIVGSLKEIKKLEKNKIIMGIDPGLKYLGIGILSININNVELIERTKKGIIAHSITPLIEDYSNFFLEIKTKRKIEEKLFFIFETIDQLIKFHKPDLIIIEDSFVGFNKNSSIKLALSRGSILTAIGKNKIECLIISPSLIKMTLTQKGNATKEEIEDFFKDNLKDWQSQIKLDSSDALAAAFFGIQNFL